MSIKSDKWIRRMAAEKGMITPFARQQVKESAQGKVISYGTSSYGYDVRCADEFKIFTNINSAIVDPKNFSDKSFVDVQADVCIIPPNSFALARTVEFFKIPRDVLTICLGKCLTADTRLLNTKTGAYSAITDFSAGMQTLALDAESLAKAQITDFIPQGKHQVYELTTANGFKIQATAQHPFKQKDSWTELDKLQLGDEIMVANHIPVFGTKTLLISELRLLGIILLLDTFNIEKINFSCNDPLMTKLFVKYIHRLSHNGNDSWIAESVFNIAESNKKIPEIIFKLNKKNLKIFLQVFLSTSINTIITDPVADCDITFVLKSQFLADEIQHLLLRFGISIKISLQEDHYKLQIIGIEQITRFQQEIGFYVKSEAFKIAETFQKIVLPPLNATDWDTISSIKAIGIKEVYDLTVPKLHNFVANGLVVHNSTYARCGIIVNVTPLEPEWEGHVTLEFSNTTPLPAKIYANEGVAQMLFFGSDEVCEISYKDRKGKYQGQAGVTLPKA